VAATDSDIMLWKTIVERTTPPLEVLRGMVNRYGVDWLGWPYSVVKQTLDRELRAASAGAARAETKDGDGGGEIVPEWALHRVCALGAVALQDTFWTDWEHFHFLTQALNGDVADFRNHRLLTIGQMMLAVYAAEQVRHDLGHLVRIPAFSEEVARYVAAQALAQSVWYLPRPLDFARKYAAGVRYRCRDCGNDSEVLFDDGLCDVCVHRFDTSRLGAWRPDPEVLARGWGKHTEIYEKNPTGPVAKRLAEIAVHPDRTLQESPVDICVARLLAAGRYARYPVEQEWSRAA